MNKNIKKLSIFNSQISTQRGFSLIEVILAAAIFITFAVAAMVAVISGLNANRLGGEVTIANQYNTEALEAVRSIRNQSFATLASKAGLGNQGLAVSGGVWTFDGSTSDTLASDTRFARSVAVTSVQRDGSGNIVASGGTVDANTYKVTATTTWNFNTARPESAIFTTYLTNWEAPIITGGPTMMVYSKTTTTPFYRLWDGSNWGTEGSAQTVGGNINYVVLKSSRTRNEAILGTLDSNGNIAIQTWNGTTWSAVTTVAAVGAANATTRSFDIEYEKSGDRAIIAYLPNSTSADFAYRVWNGTTLSSATTITTPPTTGVIKSIDLAQNPGISSNEVALILFDANSDIYGMAWNGSSWGTMGDAAVWDATASTATAKKPIAVAYEQTSGRAMFIWADSVATDQYYRIWNGTSLTAATLLDTAASGGIGEWVKLVSRPSSNELLYGVQDAGADLNTRKWSGSAWDTATEHAEHSAAVENITSMVFDLVWETHSSNLGDAWLVWGDGATVSKKQWSGSAWGAASTLTGSDDTSFIRLKADPTSGAVFAGIYEDATSATDDIWESRLTGGSATWTAKNTIWGGPTGGTPVFFRIDIATP